MCLRQIHAACYTAVGSNPVASNFFWMFNLGIASGAKVVLKLRLMDSQDGFVCLSKLLFIGLNSTHNAGVLINYF